MLKGIPEILSPELLKVLCEMGHSDRLVIADGNFPVESMGKNAITIRCDGHGVPEILDAILKLFPLGYLGKKNHLIDYGCGKGRVDFFLAWQVRCRTTGVEYDERMTKAAEENRQRAVSGTKTSFILENAALFQVPESADRFYFFNPFSVEILRSVIGRIRESWYEKTREMLLFFYYPSDEYISYLMTVDELEFLDEIDCQDLFDGKNLRERILVFQMGEE